MPCFWYKLLFHDMVTILSCPKHLAAAHVDEPCPLSRAPCLRRWSLPHVSVGFQARGMKLLEALDLAHLGSVNTLPAPRCASCKCAGARVCGV